jgi:hypothetical protein
MNPDELSVTRLSITESDAAPAGTRLDEPYNVWSCISHEFLQDLSQDQLSIRSAEEEHEDLSDDGAWRLTFRAHFERNLQILKLFLDTSSEDAGPNRRWLVEELSCESVCQIAGVQSSGGGRRFVILKPSASRVPSLVLNPATYRKLTPIPTLDGFAVAMRVRGWEHKMAAARESRPALWEFVYILLDNFSKDRNASEILVTAQFMTLVMTLSQALGIRCSPLGDLLLPPRRSYLPTLGNLIMLSTRLSTASREQIRGFP